MIRYNEITIAKQPIRWDNDNGSSRRNTNIIQGYISRLTKPNTFVNTKGQQETCTRISGFVNPDIQKPAGVHPQTCFNEI